MFEKNEKPERAEKIEKKKKEDESGLDVKIRAIRESKMPIEQQEALLKEIGVKVDEAPKGVPFSVYAQIKRIPKTIHKAMQLYPKAKNVSLASLEEWESIFKDF
jgi:hypothetical protein